MTRRSHREKRVANTIQQLPWRDVVNPYRLTEVLADEQVERIIDGALSVLENQGMRFLEPGSRAQLARDGADVDESSMMVRFDRNLVREKVALVPSEFGLRARNPQHDLIVG
ncbi:MAG: trimethylamine methyltransferase family protein, partial [Gammaproteobacteria bacterium]|nr:trimethylamine methyltransferase family protein [Gammaproteobacteria bacterium]